MLLRLPSFSEIHYLETITFCIRASGWLVTGLSNTSDKMFEDEMHEQHIVVLEHVLDHGF
jgi:hypothetical protein